MSSENRLWRVEVTDDFGGLHIEVVDAHSRDDAMLRVGAMIVSGTGIPYHALHLASCENYPDIEELCTGSTSTTSMSGSGILTASCRAWSGNGTV